MKADKDIYADKDGKITNDPTKFAFQVAVAGHELDDRVVKRYGISDALVSVDEPGAVRSVRMKGESEAKPAEEPEVAAEAAAEDAASPEVEKPKTEAKEQPAAKKGAKKKP